MQRDLSISHSRGWLFTSIGDALNKHDIQERFIRLVQAHAPMGPTVVMKSLLRELNWPAGSRAAATRHLVHVVAALHQQGVKDADSVSGAVADWVLDQVA